MMSKHGPAYTEIGQIILTNSDTFSHEAYWATEGLITLANVIAEQRGLIKENHEYVPTITSGYDSEEFVNDTFELRAYCWCYGDEKGHEPFCPPNFIYKPSGIEINWYKHAGRGITANVEYLSPLTWHRVINDCIESIFK